MNTVSVRLSENPYTIHIGHGIASTVAAFARRKAIGNFGVIITSHTIYALYKKLFKETFPPSKYKCITISDGEKAKSKEWVFKIIREMIKADTLKRQLFLICIGGGTVGDVGGFVAAIYKRGIPYLQVPTTFLAQIDSSIGGKTGINLKEAKNIIGSFYQPRAVFIDPQFLKTLPSGVVKEGAAEAIKYGIISDRNLFYFLKRQREEVLNLDEKAVAHVIKTCVQIKASIVEEDEKEKKGIRTILNFGHTFAHALESTSQYKRVSHGKAVSAGMVFSALLSYELGVCRKEVVEEIKSILRQFSLPLRFPFNSLALLEAIRYDKKFRGGSMRMVLLKDIGKVAIRENIPSKKVRKLLKNYPALIDK